MHPDDRTRERDVLLVDDDAEVASLVVRCLTGRDRVRCAGTAAAAIASLERDRPDLVLLDILLPDQDGLVLCAEIRASLDVPIVVCSGSSRTRDPALALWLGAEAYLRKPFTRSELLATVEAALAHGPRPTPLVARRPRSGAT